MHLTNLSKILERHYNAESFIVALHPQYDSHHLARNPPYKHAFNSAWSCHISNTVTCVQVYTCYQAQLRSARCMASRSAEMPAMPHLVLVLPTFEGGIGKEVKPNLRSSSSLSSCCPARPQWLLLPPSGVCASLMTAAAAAAASFHLRTFKPARHHILTKIDLWPWQSRCIWCWI